MDDFSNAFNPAAFYEKLNDLKSAARQLTEDAVILFVLLMEGDIPLWIKTAIVAALGYLISPVDAIPDVIPILGYTDDAAILTALVIKLKSYIQPHHRTRAQQMLSKLRQQK